MIKEETINGFTVIAERATPTARHILGHRPMAWGHEYVVGRYVNDERTGWSSGMYTHDLAQALETLNAL